MNPFSTRYFLRQNIRRLLTIILMIGMIALIYVGGLYLTNISEESKAMKKELQNFVTVWSTYEDTDNEQLKALEEEISDSDIVEAFHVTMNYYRHKTMLGFRYQDRAYVFTKDDFDRFNAKKHIIASDVELSVNTIFLSEKLAAYLKIKEGDFLEPRYTEELEIYHGTYPFQVFTFPSDAFSAYFVIDEPIMSGTYLLTWKEGVDQETFYQKVAELEKQYDKIEFTTYDEELYELKDNFEINNLIYYSIIAIVSIVFAITTNAVFVGLYDKRKQEFALYQGIGIPKVKIYRKVIAEILCMNGLGLLLGAGLSLIVISLLNVGLYHKDGLSMWYYHPTAFFATLLCDLAILIPGIGLRIHRISKDIKDVDFL